MTEKKDIFIVTDEAFRKLRRNEDDMLEKYIRCQAFFPEFPVINALLVAVQRPDAEVLRNKKGWEMDGIHVRNSEQPLILLDLSGFSGEKASITRCEQYDITQTDKLFAYSLNRKYGTERLQKGLFRISPVPVERNPRLQSPARYDRKKHIVFVRLKDEDPVEWSFIKTIREIVEAVFYLNSPQSEHETIPWKAWVITKMLMIRYSLSIKENEQPEMPDHIKNMQEKSFRRAIANMRKVFYMFFEAFEWSVKESKIE